MVCLSDSTVQNIISRIVCEEKIHIKGRKALNKSFNERDERYIVRRIIENPKLCAAKFAV